MSITVTFNDFNEMIAFAKQLIGSPVEGQIKQNVPVEEVQKTNTLSGETRTEDVKKNEVEKPHTLEEVRAELAKLTRAGKAKEVKALLTSFGAKNLSSVDPKDYAALIEKAGEI